MTDAKATRLRSVIATTISTHLRRSNTESPNMDNFLDSVTRKGRKFKDRLKGKKGKRDRTGANTAEESIGSPSSLLQPAVHIAAGGHDGEESRVSTDTRKAHSSGRSPQPESVPVGWRDDDGKGKEVDVGGKEVSQRDSEPDHDVEDDVKSGSNRGVEQVNPPSIPIPQSGEPDGTLARSF